MSSRMQPLSRYVAMYSYTALLHCGYLCLGLAQNMPGPTLLDLCDIYGLNVAQAALFFASQSAGMLIAAMGGNIIYAYFSPGIAIPASLLLGAVGAVTMPVAGYTYGAHLGSGAVGAAMALFQMGSKVAIVQIWKKPTFCIQMYYLCYGIGCLVAPLLAGPFLRPLETDVQYAQSIQLNGSFVLPGSRTTPLIFIPYLISAGLLLLVGICIYLLGCFIPITEVTRCTEDKHQSTEENDENPSRIAVQHKEDNKGRLRCLGTVLIILLSFVECFDFSIAAVVSGLLTTFAVRSSLHLSKSTGAYMTGAYRTAFTFGRFLAMVSHRLNLVYLLWASVLLLITTSLIMIFIAEESAMYLWAGVIFIGFSHSVVVGSSTSWVCQYIELKHWHISILLMTSSLNQLVPSMIIGPWMDSYPMALILALLALSIGISICLSLMMISVAGIRRRLESHSLNRQEKTS